MQCITKKLLSMLWLLSISLSIVATHYTNHTNRAISVTNVSAIKRSKKPYFSKFAKKTYEQTQEPVTVHFIALEHGQEGDLDNNQGDEIAITSPGMSDKRKLFPTNNSFNYVVTMNAYHKRFEQFDINRAGNEEEMATVASKKAKAAKKKMKKIEKQKQKKLQQQAQ